MNAIHPDQPSSLDQEANIIGSGRRHTRSAGGAVPAWLLAGILVASGGCVLPQEVSKTPRSATEQLLRTESVKRALIDLDVPLPKGATVEIQVGGLQTDRAHVHMSEEEAFGVVDAPSWDLGYVRDAATARLGALGYLVRRSAGETAYVARVMVESIGTNQGRTFFGMPPVQSVLIPFALPQLTLYQEVDQLAHVRLHVDLYDGATGGFIRSSPTWIGTAYYNQYTVLFFLTWTSTDLVAAP
jgi:hypothetical protein